MWFESVKAHAFGPLREKELLFEPGMNVIYGPNEVGKSTWHSALFAGLCGQRRSRGRLQKSDRAFQERHEPWDDKSAWEVGAVVALDRGIRVELRHDLSGNGDSARDAVIAGRDYANEIIFEGTPDGSTWLGLNRRSFLSVACVRQADILSVLDDADALQEDLQRAAATAGTDGTAASALNLLTVFRSEHIGSKRAPTKPLQKSAQEVRAKRDRLEFGLSKHTEYLTRRNRLLILEQTAAQRQGECEADYAVRAEGEAARAQRRLTNARELSARFPDGAPHFSHEHDHVAQRIATALHNWDVRPKLHAPEGPTVQELILQITGSRQRLDAMRALLHEQRAVEASERLVRAEQLRKLFPDGAPHYSIEHSRLAEQVAMVLERWRTRPAPSRSPGLTEQELERQMEELNHRLTELSALVTSRLRTTWTRVCAAAILVTGGTAAALLGFSGEVLLSLLAGVASVGVCIWILVGLARRMDATAVSKAENRAIVEEKRRSVAAQLAHRRKEDAAYERAMEQVHAAAAAVRAAASAVDANCESVEAQVQALANWKEQERRLLEKHERRTGEWDELQQLLAGQTLDEVTSEVVRLHGLARMFATRAGAWMDSARDRPPITEEQILEIELRSESECGGWQSAIGQREEEDRNYTERKQEYERVNDDIGSACRSIGADVEDIESMLHALRDWQKQRGRELDEHSRRSEKWDKLQQLLGGRTLKEMAEDAEQHSEDARTRVAAIDGSILALARINPLPDDHLSTLDRQADDARRDADTARGELFQFAEDLPSVADAEDELKAAEREHDRVKRLDSTLARTIEFLEGAEERVNRNLAPVLRNSVIEWLSRVTGGRYVDCRVDPESLAVDVSGVDGRWRAARLLSHGTAEQVYLLLRVALAKHLANPDERCPLIFDDVTAASDAERTCVVLETLLAISRSMQVILFTHEDEVRAWAKQRLCASPNQLIELDQTGVPMDRGFPRAVVS